MELTFYAHRKMHHTARMLAMKINDKIKPSTSREKVTEFIREYMDIPHGSDDAVVEFFINRQRSLAPTTEKLVSTREYKPDMAMRAAMKKVETLPVPITIKGR